MDSLELRQTLAVLSQKNEIDWVIFGNNLHEENTFSEDDLDYIITCARQYQPKILGLANLGLTDDQICFLVPKLATLTHEQELYLPFNLISNRGAMGLADWLMKNPPITGLYLFSNHIDDVGIIALANALIANDTLTKLELFNNPFTPAVEKEFESVLELNHNLEDLVLFPSSLGNTLAPKAIDTLSDQSDEEEPTNKLTEQLAENKFHHEYELQKFSLLSDRSEHKKFHNMAKLLRVGGKSGVGGVPLVTRKLK